MNGTTGYGNAVGRGLCAVLAILLLGGCSHTGPEPSSADGTDPARSSTPASSAAASTAEPVPATLEQELLKRRGLAFDRSDYKKFAGGEGILDIHSEFDLNVDHSYSYTIDEIVVSGGKVYFANCHMAFADGRNIREVGALPESGAVQYWHYTYDGEMGSMYFAGGAGYKVSCAPLSASPLDPAQDPLFEKVYRYAADGKALEDHTEEFRTAAKLYDTGTRGIALIGGRVCLLSPAQYLDPGTTGWNWYYTMGRKTYIAFDLNLSAIGDEMPVRLFNRNILMTDRAFYEIVYLSEELDDNDERAQLAPDGSVSPYYPAAEHLNCNLGLRRIELLSRYYGDVRNISTGYVITGDYTLLPIQEVMTEGYDQYVRYDCLGFGKAYR